MQTRFLEDLVAKLELGMPWLLPALEALEQTVPWPTRLLLCVPLMAALGLLRMRRAVRSVPT